MAAAMDAATTELTFRVFAYAGIASASIFYTWLWWFPASWIRLIRPIDPCWGMSSIAHVLKLWQGLIICLTVDWAAASALPYWMYAAGFALAAVGQHLNVLVYAKLGHDGVYYGARFGKTIPWVYDYPYSLVRDPQYVGALITLAALAFIMPLDLTLFWVANYLYLIYLESTCESTPAVAALAARESKKRSRAAL